MLVAAAVARMRSTSLTSRLRDDDDDDDSGGGGGDSGGGRRNSKFDPHRPLEIMFIFLVVDVVGFRRLT